MRRKLREEISEALEVRSIGPARVLCRRPMLPAILPGLEVEGLGTIGLPLTVKQAGKNSNGTVNRPLTARGRRPSSTRASGGVWRLEPDRFSLSNPEWDQFLKTTLGKVQDMHGARNARRWSAIFTTCCSMSRGASSCPTGTVRSLTGWSRLWSLHSLRLTRGGNS